MAKSSALLANNIVVEPIRKPIFAIVGKKQGSQLKQDLVLSLISDLTKIGWKLKSKKKGSLEFVPPPVYEKEVVQKAMSFARKKIIDENKDWIEKYIETARKNLGVGTKVAQSKIIPKIEICETKKQHRLFRLFRYYWSSPSSDYVGRRVKIIVRDEGVEGSPIIGIAALGSSIIHITERDNWIGWDIKTRTNRIVYMMDAYVLGALPPYNHILGGKLMSYILASNEMRALIKKKYVSTETIINKRKASELVLLVTTSLYGNSSQYNRLKYLKSLLYHPIGSTSGYGSLHISAKTFALMRKLAKKRGLTISHEFGKGPNWRMRVIRTACNELGIDPDVILKHSFKRGIYACPLAVNWRSYLTGKARKAKYRNMPLQKLVNYWRTRWFDMRRQNDFVMQKVKEFDPKTFAIG